MMGDRVERSKKESQMHHKKQQKLQEYKFDKNTKGWRGPSQPSSVFSVVKAVTKMTRLRENRQLQKKTAEQAPVVMNTKRAVAEAPVLDLDHESDSDVGSISEDPGREKPSISSPFNRGSLGKPNWNRPKEEEQLTQKKKEMFQFEKPHAPVQTDTEEPVATLSPNQQVVRLTKEVKNKEQEVQILRRQLLQAHKEAAKMSSELSRYSGADYEELKAENARLKSTLSRMSRDNSRLHGEVRAANNSVISKLEMEEELDRRYGLRPPPSGSARVIFRPRTTGTRGGPRGRRTLPAQRQNSLVAMG